MFGDRHVIVMVGDTEETPYLSGFLATMTVMTLMTLIYGLILDEGDAPLLCRLSCCFNLPDVPDAGSRKSYSCAIFGATSGVGFV